MSASFNMDAFLSKFPQMKVVGSGQLKSHMTTLLHCYAVLSTEEKYAGAEQLKLSKEMLDFYKECNGEFE